VRLSKLQLLNCRIGVVAEQIENQPAQLCRNLLELQRESRSRRATPCLSARKAIRNVAYRHANLLNQFIHEEILVCKTEPIELTLLSVERIRQN